MNKKSNLTYIEINSDSENIDKLNQIYLEAFPPEERPVSFNDIVEICDTNDTGHIVAACDGDALAGFAIYQEYDKFVFLIFYAINSNIRGKGYGSTIISDLINKFAGKDIIGAAESPLQECDNLEQRIARKRFYEKNGIYYSKYEYDVAGVIYTCISSGNQDKLPKYLGIIADTLLPMYEDEELRAMKELSLKHC